MDTKDTLQSIESRKMKPVDFVYLGVVFLLCIITAILFFFSTSFIINNINKIFSPAEQTTAPSLDIAKYSLVEKRLNLPSNSLANSTTTPPVEVAPIDTTTPPVEVAPIDTTIVETPVVVAPTLDKTTVKIEIINSTLKSGVATLLSKALEADGFSKATTISKTVKTIGTTTILIKDSMKDYQSFIEDVVKNSYSKAITKTNPESSKFDVIITIGK